MTLFYPWRNEKEDILNKIFEFHVDQNKEQISRNADPFFALTEQEERAMFNLLEEIQGDIDDDEIVNYMAQNDQGIQKDEDAMIEGIEGQKGRTRARVEQFRPPKMVDENDYLNIMGSLNEKQRRFVLDVLHQYKTID